ncbi:MAG: endopeptidase La [Candidatus Marinimicrobia bacterium]|nr:endopeptidase La [Candidatus Neomarinimicrobiota bacterium]
MTKLKKVYPVLPLRNTVLFPNQIIPIYIGRQQSLKLIADVSIQEDKNILVVAQKDGNKENPQPEDLYEHAVLGKVMKVFDMPDKSKSAIVKGIERIKITKFNEFVDYYTAEYEISQNVIDHDELEMKALTGNIKSMFSNLIEVAPYLSDEQSNVLSNLQSPEKIADKAISLMNISTAEKQSILEELNIYKRLERTSVLINHEIQRIELGDRIQADVQDEISKTQKEYYLREQLKAIKKELGEDESNIELKEIEEKIKNAKMPKEVLKVANKELSRLEKIPTHSPEYTVTRTYLDWLVELPWEKESEDIEDLEFAKNTLDEDHFGLDKVKERVIEHLAVRSLKKSRSKEGEKIKSPILCFSGPPGTGKTSIGKSIAKSMGREFVRISLGGIRDEAEIRGHRRTYIGALPGRIISSLKKAGTNNPIFILDEIDKLGMDFRGDPSSALLEVLDPEQNFSFNDHYLEVDFDLSNVMFITTANRIDQIPGPLRDRMEILDFTGYIHDEKLQIAKKHLLPKSIKSHGLKKNEIKVEDESISKLIESYTREAGVRNLERQISNVCRKTAKDIATKVKKKVVVTPEVVHNYLGPEVFFSDVAERANKPGVVVGLAWTAFGGDILFIEACKMPGKGMLKLTGKLGDVMKESAQAAFSYVRTNAKKLGIDQSFYKKHDIHIHVPAGAIPKDGPSAGVSMITAIVSLLLNKSVKSMLGMTGEISLRGNVLPIGGLKEKSTAAHRAGLNHIIAPHLNEKDLEEIPSQVKKDLKITFVKDVEDVIKLALDN